MKNLKCLLFACLCLFVCLPSIASSSDLPRDGLLAPGDWGAAAGIRSGTILCDTEDTISTSFLPQLYYAGERFYLDGAEGGVHLFNSEKLQFSLLARVRFFDAPKGRQNQLKGDALDWGGQVRYRFDEFNRLELEMLSDPNGRLHANLRYSLVFARERFEFNPYVNLRAKSAAFNNRYYGLDWAGFAPIDAGVDLQAGVHLRYHIHRNLYLLGGIETGLLDSEAQHAEAIHGSVPTSVFAGFGFFNDHREPNGTKLGLRPWVRLAQGFATPSSIGNILTGTVEDDPYNNQLTSLFFGLPLADNLFDFPLEIYLTPGIVWHHSSSVQDDGSEFVVAVKAYYRFHWPVQMRLGLGTGFSWVSKITYQERSNNESKGYLPSNLLHYLDFSFDLNLGDLVRSEKWERFWLGVGVHHRSAIFESAQQYGRIKGGSNYPMLYLQVDF